jgi:hypothetical protein
MRRLPIQPFVSPTAFHYLVPFLSVVLLFLSIPRGVYAQMPDSIGVRAQGMGGAFTAIADDATATWWNPAGLATGAYLNMTLEYGEADEPPFPGNAPHRGFALAFPALGLSFYRMTVSEIAPPPSTSSTGGSSAGRQDPGIPSVRTLEVSQFGATVGQSIGRYLVVATTFKAVNGNDDTDPGLDVGAMVHFGALRAGVIVRNVREPVLGEGVAAVTLKRQARAGAAVSAAASAPVALTLAFDADVLDIPTALGDERRVAGGVEVWTRGRLIGGRGGISVSTIGDHRESYSGGVSVAVHRGFYGEAQLTGGSDSLRQGWNLGFRMTF